MPVKSSQSGSRILLAMELIAEHQPLGVTELSRLLDASVSATQRALETLSKAGWIRMAKTKQTQWEMSTRLYVIARNASTDQELRRHAQHILAQLCRDTNESVFLNVPDGNKFVVIHVFESPQFIKASVPVGTIIPPHESATGWAILPYLPREQQQRLLGSAPTGELLSRLKETVNRGYSIYTGPTAAGATTIAAPVFGMTGYPVAAVLVCVPATRADKDNLNGLGSLLKKAAQEISCGSGTVYF